MYKAEYTHRGWIADKLLKKKYGFLELFGISLMSILISHSNFIAAGIVALLFINFEIFYAKKMSKTMVNFYLYKLKKMDGVKILEVDDVKSGDDDEKSDSL